MAELTSVFRWWDFLIVSLVLVLLECCIDILQESDKEPPIKTITRAAALTFGHRTFLVQHFSLSPASFVMSPSFALMLGIYAFGRCVSI